MLGLQASSQTFSDVQRLTDIKKSLRKIWQATTIATKGFGKIDKVELREISNDNGLQIPNVFG